MQDGNESGTLCVTSDKKAYICARKNGMFCRKCGKSIDDNIKYCPYCGCSQYTIPPEEPVRISKPQHKKKTVKTVLTILIAFIVAGLAVASIILATVLLRNQSDGLSETDRMIVDICLERSSSFYRPATFRITDISELEITRDNEYKTHVHVYVIDYMIESKGGSVVEGVFFINIETWEWLELKPEWTPGTKEFENASGEEKVGFLFEYPATHWIIDMWGFLMHRYEGSLNEASTIDSLVPFDREHIKVINNAYQEEL